MYIFIDGYLWGSDDILRVFYIVLHNTVFNAINSKGKKNKKLYNSKYFSSSSIYRNRNIIENKVTQIYFILGGFKC